MNFFELSTPAHLFQKLESDFEALKTSGQDTRVAFNFFVTAEHLPDWLGKRDLVKKHAFLRVVSHLANGAKHFTVDRHSSVTGTEKERVYELGVIDVGYYYEPLWIHLSATEEAELGVQKIDALNLGQQVVEFWRQHIPAATNVP